MGIPLSTLPPELQRRILEETGATPPRRRRAPAAKPHRSTLMRACACGFEIFRPHGQYPECCDGCGDPWPVA